jgi:hypothetical protein
VIAEAYSTPISVVALVVSCVTAWLTFFKRGKMKMTRPTVIYFGPDGGRSQDGVRLPKVFLRALLFSTSKRGRIIQSMHVALSRNETIQNFNIWVYGDDKLVRGSGLFIGETGIAVNHHFLLPNDSTSFRFIEGRYKVEVFANLLGDKSQTLLFSEYLEVSRDFAALLANNSAGLYFDWGPDSMRYLPHVDHRPSPDPEKFLEMLGIK